MKYKEAERFAVGRIIAGPAIAAIDGLNEALTSSARMGESDYRTMAAAYGMLAVRALRLCVPGVPTALFRRARREAITQARMAWRLASARYQETK